MKENIIISSLAILILALGITLIYEPNDKEVYASTNNEIVTENSLAMMYETEAGSGEYQIANDNTWPQEGYVFNAELSKCENGSSLTWSEESNSVLIEANISDKCYVYFDKEPDVINLSDYITNNVYTGTDGDNGLYYHDGSGSYTNSDQEAEDNSYRYAGANPNNYVCFGSDATPCPADNLYRVIGIFGNQIKLIKYDYAVESVLGTSPASSGTPNSSYYKGNLNSIPYYYWSGSSSNASSDWGASTLNSDVLNGTYLTGLGNSWTEMISLNNWYVGGGASANIRSTPKISYNYELGENKINTTYNAKVGLMYVSDYGYAASPENWSVDLGSFNSDSNRNNNWMYMGGVSEVTITPYDTSAIVYLIGDTGDVGYTISGVHRVSLAVRPTFYLQPWVLYSNGYGSKENPYRISAPENLISFTVDDVIYYAEKGMTWEEWVNTDYNVDNFYIDMSSVCAVMSLENVKSTDVIGENATYVRSRFRCSLIAG